jgi:magnesium chelatase subunit I
MNYLELTSKQRLNIKTLGELKATAYQSESIKEELRRNLIARLKKKKRYLRKFGDMKIL